LGPLLFLSFGSLLVQSQLMSLEFFIDIKSFQSHYGPGIDSASNKNEYQEHFLGGKGDRCLRLTTLPPLCAIVMNSGNLNFLEASGPPRPVMGLLCLLLPFLLYVNDLLKIINKTSEPIVSTDDDTVLFSHSNLIDLNKNIHIVFTT